MADHEHVDVTGVRDEAGPDTGAEGRPHRTAPRDADDDLRRVEPAGEVEHRLRGVVPGDPVVGAAEPLGQLPQLRE